MQIDYEEEYEAFTDSQRQILEHFVTNTTNHIFALRNLPEVIKGALFSRYSRSPLGLRTLLLKEFIANEEEASFFALVGEGGHTALQKQSQALKRAQSFYDRILDGYGDDSIGELGGAHLALENVSMIAAKAVEDCRIGGSPLEKSTRYVAFDKKYKGEYLFFHEPVLMTSAFRSLYLDTCNGLFDTYCNLIEPMTKLFEGQHPRDAEVSPTAYHAALRSKVYDCLRGLLPACTLTNMGVYGNGRFFETLVKKLQCNPLSELQDVGTRAFEELSQIMPSFLRRATLTHPTFLSYAEFQETMTQDLEAVAKIHVTFPEKISHPGVRLIGATPDAAIKVAATLLFAHCDRGLQELEHHCRQLSDGDLSQILDAACSARENRRHKSPRALERASFTFEIIADFGAYRDLQRHRLVTQERQLLTCDYGYHIPATLVGTPMEQPYVQALEKAREAYVTIAHKFPEEAQYVVPMAYHIRWYFHMNLRELQWLCELRSQPAGHTAYRLVAQEMAKEVIQRYPTFERFLHFVDYEGYELGRLDQEKRLEQKRQKNATAARTR